MTHNLEILDTRLNGSAYDPVIFEDVKPLQDRIELLEALVLDLADIIFELTNEGHIKDSIFENVSQYEKEVEKWK